MGLSRRSITDFEYKVSQVSQEYQVKITNYENRIKQQAYEMEDLKRKLQNQNDSVLAQYENKMSLLSQEIDRLNYILKKTTD